MRYIIILLLALMFLLIGCNNIIRESYMTGFDNGIYAGTFVTSIMVVNESQNICMVGMYDEYVDELGERVYVDGSIVISNNYTDINCSQIKVGDKISKL